MVSSSESTSVDLGALSNMALCALGLWGSFFYWGLLQEKLVTQHYEVQGQLLRFKNHPLQHALQAFVAAVVAWAILRRQGKKVSPDKNDEKKPLIAAKGQRDSRTLNRSFFLNAVLSTISRQLGYSAIRLLSYPLYTTILMCKMIPIALVGWLWHQQRYTWRKCGVVLVLTIGVVLLILTGQDEGTDEKKISRKQLGEEEGILASPSLSAWNTATVALLGGLLFSAVNVFLEGYTNSKLDSLVKSHGLSGTAMMFHSNRAMFAVTVGYVLLFEALGSFGLLSRVTEETFLGGIPVLAALARPHLSEGLTFFTGAPSAIWDIGIISLLNVLGQFFIYRSIALFGSLTTAALTLSRKVGTVILSVVVNQHRFTVGQWGSVSLIVAGLVVDTLEHVLVRKPKGISNSGSRKLQ
jgi:UDP-galactose transporter B1